MTTSTQAGSANAAFSAQATDLRTIGDDTLQYVGWPTLGVFGDDKLAVVGSAGRHFHVCPFGQVHYIESVDQGKTWTRSQILYDGPLDDRDAGWLTTAKGTLIATWFNSTVWRWLMANEPQSIPKHTEEEMTQWRIKADRLDDELIRRELGCWSLRSTDGGRTWSSKIDTLVNSPHGPCQLANGSLLYVGRKRSTEIMGRAGGPSAPIIGAALSEDDGQSWRYLGDMVTRPGDETMNYHELHAVQAADGTVICHIRNHNTQDRYDILQTESKDNGQTWTTPHTIGLWGYPAYLTRLADGKLLTTFSSRRDPWDIRAAVSTDHGKTWSASFPIASIALGPKSDFGYPSTIQLKDGSLVTVWYELMPRQVNTVLRLAHWKLTPA